MMELLPHSVEKFSEVDIEYDKLVYLLVIVGYTIILTFEKILFDGHSHIHDQAVPSRLKTNHENDNQDGVENLIRNSINPKTSFTLLVGRESEEQADPAAQLPLENRTSSACNKSSSKSKFSPYLLAIALSTHSVRNS